jgi:LysM repeat protein
MDADSGNGTRSPARFVDHTIASGDTLFSIARDYGSSVEVLMEVNGIADVRKVRTGTVLRVPVDPEAAGRQIERLIDRSEAHVRDARFRAALESADAARALLDSLPDSAQKESRVRLEIVTATIYVAWGDRDAALSSLGRALRDDPDLALDPAVVSPKILRVFHAARAAHAAAP